MAKQPGSKLIILSLLDPAPRGQGYVEEFL
jgi:hypothetical protein